MQQLVLTLDQAGQPVRWATWEDSVTSICKGLMAWSHGDTTIYRGGTSRLTGTQSTIAVPSIMAIKNLSKSGRLVPALSNKNLFGRDLHVCAYCGKQFQPTSLTRDHIIPKSKGGRNSWSNCVTACKRCNCKKDDNLLEDCGMALLYVPYTPNRAEALLMQNRKILADQMEFLVGYLPEHSRLRAT